MLKIMYSQAAIETLCQKYAIKSLAFFGPAVQDGGHPAKAIDVLVEFEAGVTLEFSGYLKVEAEIIQVLGHKIDLQLVRFSDPIIQQFALPEAVIAYGQT